MIIQGTYTKLHPNGICYVSKCGKVFNLNLRLLKGYSKVKPFYEKIWVYVEGKKKLLFTHRLVAETFIPNPENKPIVNHINCIKTDNRIENLQWMTQSENIQHAHDNGLITSKRKIENETIEEKRKRIYENVKRFMNKNPARFKEIQSNYYHRKKACLKNEL